jgi:hypothetical protein
MRVAVGIEAARLSARPSRATHRRSRHTGRGGRARAWFWRSAFVPGSATRSVYASGPHSGLDLGSPEQGGGTLCCFEQSCIGQVVNDLAGQPTPH